MTNEKKTIYAKAYVELYELIKNLTEQERAKIPKEFIDFVKTKMDKNYVFKINNSYGLLEQNYLTETKALIVKLYERYLAPEEDKELWKKYDMYCKKRIEEKKRELYGADIFSKNEAVKTEVAKTKNTENIEDKELEVYKEKNIIQIIKEKILNLINKFRKDN